MQASDSLVISTDNLSKSYGGVNALQPLDLQGARHSIFGFLGPNGAGKSTTIKWLLGRGRPGSGSATIFGKDSVRDSVALREKIGYLAQRPRYYDHLTARQTLRFTARFFYRGPKAAIENRIKESAVGLALGSALPAVWIIPVVATVLWTVLFLGVALWRFGRVEF